MADTGVHMIIHTASTSAAAVGGGLAQIPMADHLVIIPLQTAMIVSIGAYYGVSVTQGTATSLLATFAATVAGRTASQWLVGWIPLYGNAINATTAASITEAIGWAAEKYFRDQVGR